MSRPIRIWFPGAWYHIFARGNNKAPIFFAVCDYLKYLNLLRDAVRQYGLRLHAYALMSNHLHRMLETGDRYSATKPMQSVHTAYTMYINKRYKRVGHLFQGRYRSILVDQDAYALELSRYIHRNPVRSGLALEPQDYRWSSYRTYIPRGASLVKDFVTTDWILRLLAPNLKRGRALYRRFVKEPEKPMRDLGREVVVGQFLGSQAFVKRARGQSSRCSQGLTPKLTAEVVIGVSHPGALRD